MVVACIAQASRKNQRTEPTVDAVQTSRWAKASKDPRGSIGLPMAKRPWTSALVYDHHPKIIQLLFARQIYVRVIDGIHTHNVAFANLI
jgi:hypothetical protein